MSSFPPIPRMLQSSICPRCATVVYSDERQCRACSFPVPPFMFSSQSFTLFNEIADDTVRDDQTTLQEVFEFLLMPEWNDESLTNLQAADARHIAWLSSFLDPDIVSLTVAYQHWSDDLDVEIITASRDIVNDREMNFEIVTLPLPDTCSVCLEDLTGAMRLPCGHVFHSTCIHKWFVRHGTCPTCRATVLT